MKINGKYIGFISLMFSCIYLPHFALIFAWNMKLLAFWRTLKGPCKALIPLWVRASWDHLVSTSSWMLVILLLDSVFQAKIIQKPHVVIKSSIRKTNHKLSFIRIQQKTLCSLPDTMYILKSQINLGLGVALNRMP